MALVCKQWYHWVKEQDAGERLITQPIERLFLICSSSACSLIAAEGILSEDRSTLMINLLPSCLPKRALYQGRAGSLNHFTPTFAQDAQRIDLLANGSSTSGISYDPRKRDGWLFTALPPPEEVGCLHKDAAEEADLGRGCGLGPHKSLFLYIDPIQPLAVQSESGESLAFLESNEASSQISFVLPRTALLTFRGDCYLLGPEKGVCLNRKTGKGDRFVPYIWSTSDGRALPTNLEIEWSGVLVGCR